MSEARRFEEERKEIGMQKEMIIVVIIIIVVLAVNITTDKYTNNCVSAINLKLEEICDMASASLEEERENNQMIEKMDALREEWSNFSKKLAFYIEHDEIEKVDTSIVEINEYIKLGLYDEAIPEIRKCSFILEHIKNKGELQVINLF